MPSSLLSSGDNRGLFLVLDAKLSYSVIIRAAALLSFSSRLHPNPAQPGICILNWWTSSSLKGSAVELAIFVKFRGIHRKLTS